MKNYSKTILVLGAKSDIAQQATIEFAKQGFSIILAAREVLVLENFSKDLNLRYQVDVQLKEFDATNYDSHQSFYEELDSIPLVTLCVFGYLGDKENAINNFDLTEKIISTNYVGAVSILNIVSNSYEQINMGTIIGVSSVAGDRGRQSNYFYGSAKAGFTAYLSGLRNRMYKYNVHVSTIKPGFVKTRMTKGLDLPPLLTASPEKLGKTIFNAYKNKKNVVYVLWFWFWIMLIIKLIPETIFKRLGL